MFTIVIDTKQYFSHNTDVKTGTGCIICIKCKNLLEDEKCIHDYFVNDYSDVETLESIVLTYTVPKDQIPPKVVLSFKDTFKCCWYFLSPTESKESREKTGKTCVQITYRTRFTPNWVLRSVLPSWRLEQHHAWFSLWLNACCTMSEIYPDIMDTSASSVSKYNQWIIYNIED